MSYVHVPRLLFSIVIAMVTMHPCSSIASSTPPSKSSMQAKQVLVVKDGRLATTGDWVGTHTSELTNNVLSLYTPLEKGWDTNLSIVNQTILRYLVLEGDYLADVPFSLPSLFVLQLGSSTTIRPASNLSLANTSTFTALVMLQDVKYSAVLGGTIDASSLPASAFNYPYRRGYQAVSIKGGCCNSIRNLRASANNSDGALGVNQSPHAEIAFCNIGGGGSNGVGVTIGRCIWMLATSRALVHDNWIRNCSAHALDFDAYTSSSAAWNNVCEYNGEEGIFVEETANGNFIFNNTARYNRGTGIGVYSNAVGPVASNMFIANTLLNNSNAISAGGMGHEPTKTSKSNIFAANRAIDNGGHDGGQYNVHHGAVLQDYWIGNTAQGTEPEYGSVPQNETMVTIFDPEPVQTP